MKDYGKVSILIPVYNMEQLVEKAIRSALNQTYNNVEVIVVNDGSTDSTRQICESIAEKDQRVQVINQKNGGIGCATNTALDNASGDFIVTLDSDDYIAPNMVQKLLETMEETDADIVQCGRYHFLNISGIPIVHQENATTIYTREEVLYAFFHNGFIGGDLEARIYKAALFDGIRCPEGRQIIDIVTAPRLLDRCNRYAYITGKYYYNYMAPNSMSRGDYTPQRWDDALYANAFFDEFIKCKCPEFINYVYYRYVHIGLRNYIAVNRSKSIGDKERIKELIRNNYNQYYHLYKSTEYYSERTIIQKIKEELFNISPFIFTLVFDKCSHFTKDYLLVPVYKIKQKITKS